MKNMEIYQRAIDKWGAELQKDLAKEKIIIHVCADIGSDSVYYKKNGYNVIRVGKEEGVENFHPPKNVYGVIANPPCTMFSIARTTAKSSRDLKSGMFLVKECLRVIWECQYNIAKNQRTSNLKFWALENPATGFLKWFLGEPVFTYEQWEFGGNKRKKTALWGMFNIPLLIWGENRLPEKGMTNGRSKEWGNKKNRSLCCDGFAKAFYEANK